MNKIIKAKRKAKRKVEIKLVVLIQKKKQMRLNLWTEKLNTNMLHLTKHRKDIHYSLVKLKMKTLLLLVLVKMLENNYQDHQKVL